MFSLFCDKAQPEPVVRGIRATPFQVQHTVLFFDSQLVFSLQAGMRKAKDMFPVFFIFTGKKEAKSLTDSVRDVKISSEHTNGFFTPPEKERGERP